MYIVVCVATLTSSVNKGFHAYKKQVDIGTKLRWKHIEAIVTGEARSAPEGAWVIGGTEAPCKYLFDADKKLKSKIRTMLRKASM